MVVNATTMEPKVRRFKKIVREIRKKIRKPFNKNEKRFIKEMLKNPEYE